MRKTLLSALIGAALVLACGEDVLTCDCDGFTPPPPPRSFEALTQRDHVLNNLELSYNNRVVARFDELLDDGFMFFLSPGDVGGDIPEKWGRVDELAVTTLLFDPALNQPPYPTCRSIRVDLKFESGVQWVDVPSPDVIGEIWSTTSIYFEFTFEIEPDQTYIAVPGSLAQFTVRNSGTDDAPQWRLVEWRDLGDGSAALRSAASTEGSTWSDVKALYHNAVLQREHVLGNLELSYNQRSVTRFGEVLDDNFTFFFSPGDVGGSIPEQWGRVEETTATSRLFDRNLNDPNYPTCRSIYIDIKLEGGVQWVEVIPEEFPDEIWYATTVGYEFAFVMYSNNTYIAQPGSLAQFTVRNAGTVDAADWRLIEWRDLGRNSLVARAIGQATTWGGVKSLYW